MWIKAHVGHPGNERADFLAKRGTLDNNKYRIPYAPNILKEKIREKIRAEWQRRWVNEPTCRQTKQFFPKPDKARSKKILTLARSQLSTLVQITTGHNSLAYPASKEDPTIDPLCCLCSEEPETFLHFLTNCPRLRLTRDMTSNTDFNSETWTPECVLELAKVPTIDALLNRF